MFSDPRKGKGGDWSNSPSTSPQKVTFGGEEGGSQIDCVATLWTLFFSSFCLSLSLTHSLQKKKMGAKMVARMEERDVYSILFPLFFLELCVEV